MLRLRAFILIALFAFPLICACSASLNAKAKSSGMKVVTHPEHVKNMTFQDGYTIDRLGISGGMTAQDVGNEAANKAAAEGHTDSTVLVELVAATGTGRNIWRISIYK
jgi:hypothetical protein